MIALTAKAAKRWKMRYAALPAVDTGAWVVDLLKLDKGPLLVLIVHQDSLFTRIRPAAELKSLEQVAAEIGKVWPEQRSDVAEIYRNGNQRVTGSITDMKHLIRAHAKFDELAQIEDSINDCPFSAIDMEHPRGRFERLSAATR